MASLLKRPNSDGSITFYGRHIYYVNGKRKEKKKSFETDNRSLAKKRLLTWEVELSSKKWGEQFAVSFDDAASKFLKEHCSHLSPHSARRYETSLVHLRKHFDTMSIQDISRADLLAFENKRRKTRRPAKGKSKGVEISSGTIVRDFNCLSSVFGFCIEKEWMDDNPVPAYLKRRKKSGLVNGNARTRYLDNAEESRLIASCTVDNGRPGHGARHLQQMLYAAVIFSIDTGARQGELFELEWHQMQMTGRPYVAIRTSKRGKPRKVPLSDRVLNVVSSLPIAPDGKFVFWWRGGQRFGHMNKGFLGAAERAGLKNLEWHDLRRTCGCRLLQDKGASMVEVQKWLGHSSVTVTERHYAFLKEDALHDLLDRNHQQEPREASATIVPMVRRA